MATYDLKDFVSKAEEHSENERKQTVDSVGLLFHRIKKLAENDDPRVPALLVLTGLKPTDPRLPIALTMLDDSPTALQDATQMIGGSTNTNGHAPAQPIAEIATTSFGPKVKRIPIENGRVRHMLPMYTREGVFTPGTYLSYDTVLNQNYEIHYDPAATDETIILGYYERKPDEAPAKDDDQELPVWEERRFKADKHVGTMKVSEADKSANHQVRRDPSGKPIKIVQLKDWDTD